MRTDCACEVAEAPDGTMTTLRCMHCKNELQQLLTDSREERARKAELAQQMHDLTQVEELQVDPNADTPRRSETPVLGSPPKLKRQKRQGRLVHYCSLEFASQHWTPEDCDDYLLENEDALSRDHAYVFEELLPAYIAVRDTEVMIDIVSETDVSDTE